MSTTYKTGDHIPSEVLCQRLIELATAVTNGQPTILREFTMRVPAERDHDADLVLVEAATRIIELETRITELTGEVIP